MTKKLKIIILIIALIVLVCGITLLSVFLTKNNNTTNNAENGSQENIETPEVSEEQLNVIAPEIINMYLSDITPLNIVVLNSNDYTITYDVLDANILNIEDKKIIAKQCGNTEIKVVVKTQKTEIVKNIKVNIYKDYSKPVLEIYKNKIKVDNIFYNEEYTLKIIFNTKLFDDANIKFSANTQNVNLVENKEQYYLYTFKVNDIQNFVVNISYQQNKNTYTFNVYEKTNDVDIYLNDKLFCLDTINLYLFNKKYTNEANNDNIFDKYKLTIKSKIQKPLNNITLSLNNDNAKLENNYIIAQKSGENILNINTNDGFNFNKQIKIKIKEISATKIIANDITSTINKENILNYNILPIYHNNIVNISCDDNNVVINSNKISCNKIGKYIVKIKAGTIEKTINYNVIEKEKLIIDFPENVILNNNIKINKNIISVDYKKDNIISFSYYFKDGNNNLVKEPCMVELKDDNFATSNFQNENNRILFKLNNKINFSILFKINEEIKQEIFFVFN